MCELENMMDEELAAMSSLEDQGLYLDFNQFQKDADRIKHLNGVNSLVTRMFECFSMYDDIECHDQEISIAV